MTKLLSIDCIESSQPFLSSLSFNVECQLSQEYLESRHPSHVHLHSQFCHVSFSCMRVYFWDHYPIPLDRLSTPSQSNTDLISIAVGFILIWSHAILHIPLLDTVLLFALYLLIQILESVTCASILFGYINSLNRSWFKSNWFYRKIIIDIFVTLYLPTQG